MGKRRGILKAKGPKTLATMTEDERQKMFDLQFSWEQLVDQTNAADAALTGFRQYIRNRYELPRVFTIDLASGVITEAPEAPEEPIEDPIGLEAR